MTSKRQEFLAWAIDKLEPEPERVHPMRGQELQIVKVWSNGYGGGSSESVTTTEDLKRADLVASRMEGFPNVHKPVLDLDMPVKVIPSSTPGHNHLYIDKEMLWDDYELLLRAMAAVGLIEPGYLKASLERKHTSVRLPWVKKAGVKK